MSKDLDLNLIEAKLYSDIVSDVLDEMGFRNQAMREDIRPIYPEAVVAGRARTILSIDVYDESKFTLELEMEAVDSLRTGEVAVVCTNRSNRAAMWGELLSTASRARGARGAIVDGLCRDVKRIVEMRFPVFATGIRPYSSNGRCIVVSYNVPVDCGGVLVKPGDLILGDIDGVVVAPQEVAGDVVERALEKVEKENVTRSELQKGLKLKEVYAKYKTL